MTSTMMTTKTLYAKNPGGSEMRTMEAEMNSALLNSMLPPALHDDDDSDHDDDFDDIMTTTMMTMTVCQTTPG